MGSTSQNAPGLGPHRDCEKKAKSDQQDQQDQQDLSQADPLVIVALHCNNQMAADNTPQYFSPKARVIFACSCKCASESIVSPVMDYEQWINFILDQSLDLGNQSVMEKARLLIKSLLCYSEGGYNYYRSKPVCIDTVNSAIDKLSADCNANLVIWKMLISSLDEEDRLLMDWLPLQNKDYKFGKKMKGRRFSNAGFRKFC